MKSKEENEQKTFVDDYEKIMRDFQKQDNPSLPQTPQWTNQGDFIIKFSLYQETPNSITSTDTSLNIGI